MSALGLNAFDYMMILVIVAFAITGALRGFALEIMSLALWPSAALLSWVFAEDVATFYYSLINDPQMRLVAGFISLFLVVFILGTIIIYFVHRALPLRGALRTPNVVLGGLAGIVRGGIIIVIVFLVAGITSMPQRPWWRESTIAPYFQKVAIVVSAYLPRDIAKEIRYS